MSIIVKILLHQRYGFNGFVQRFSKTHSLGSNIQNVNFFKSFSVQKYEVRNTSSVPNHKHKLKVTSDVKTMGEKIKENTKTASYVGIIALGVGLTGLVIYTIFKELISPKSVNTVYTRTLKRVVNDSKVQDAVGYPIRGYGEESRRRRRNHVAHSIYYKNGVEHMQMKFYIKGLRQKATVHLEMKENSVGKYDYRYLYVQLEYYPKSTIILEDNRGLEYEHFSNQKLI